MESRIREINLTGYHYCRNPEILDKSEFLFEECWDLRLNAGQFRVKP